MVLSIWTVSSGNYIRVAYHSSHSCPTAFIENQLLIAIHRSGPPKIRAPKSGTNVVVHKTPLFTSLSVFVREFATPGFAFSLLYFTVLGLDAITIGYLNSKVTANAIGLVTIGCGLLGVISTFLFPPLVSCFGLRITGVIGFFTQTILLAMCLLELAPATSYVKQTSLSEAMHLGPWFDVPISVVAFVAGIILSRVGLWIADLSVNQLIQYTSSPSDVSGVQASLNTAMNLAKFVLVAGLPLISQFWILIITSWGSVALGAVLFACYCACSKTRH